MAITLKDVASVAGVSTATVSRALAGSEKVAPHTAEYIRNVADDLGYRLDHVARALRQKRSNLIGFIAPDFSDHNVQQLIVALNQELYQSELILASASSFYSIQDELIQVERLLGQRIDALLIVPVDNKQSQRAINIALEEEIPVIQLHNDTRDMHTGHINLDYESGIEFVLRFIGKQKINTIGFYNDPVGFASTAKRNAFVGAMLRHGLTNYAIFSASQPDRFSQEEFPDVIICSDAKVARGILQLFNTHPVVGDAPVLVCLENIPDANYHPNISIISVEYSMYAVAKIAVETMTNWLNYEQRKAEIRLQPFMNLSRF